VAAIAPVAGLRLGNTAPKVPVSVLAIHCTSDAVVAYDDVHGKNATYKGMPSAVDSIEFFAQKAKARKKERETTGRGKWQIHIDRWVDGEQGTEFILYSPESGDHGWPRGGSRSLAASKVIWDFFTEHPRVVEKKAERAGKAASEKMAGSSGKSPREAKPVPVGN
jgi:poly(3-hydroxybutyrate) depolymerase